MKYVKIEWPEIQDYMHNEDYLEDCYFDPMKDCWFIPEWWDNELEDKFSGGDIGNLDDALG